MKKAIALCRVSSKDQLLSRSLELQGKSVERMAKELDAEIVKIWSIKQSSNKGKNLTRADMKEALVFCRRNKSVEYFLVDKVNRYMREMEMLFYFKVRFQQLGVRLVFCDPGQRDLNGDTLEAKWKLAQKAYDAEADNQERKELAQSRMIEIYNEGYYLSHPHSGYKTSSVKGLHVPDEPRFTYLKEGCKKIIYEQYTPSQAVQHINEKGYRTLGGKKLDVDHFTEFIVDRYYCGFIDVRSEGWPKNVKGLHQRMLSEREHKILVAVLAKRNPRIRLQHNPEFPVGNLLRHYECKDIGKYEKFTGFFKNRGKRPNGKQRNKLPVYRCRDCKKEISRNKVHDCVSEYLNRLEFIPNEQVFRKALLRVWKNQMGSASQRLNVLNINKQDVGQKIEETAVAYSVEPAGTAAKKALANLLDKYDKQLNEIETDIAGAKNADMESEDFVRFAMNFVANLKDNWWKIGFDSRQRGEQILFNGKIFLDNSAIVHTPNLSTIYRLGTNKKDLNEVNFKELVELAEYCPPRPLVYLG